jgi:hypothetical protein
MQVNRYFQWCAGCTATIITFVMLGTFTATAQEKAKPAPDKWRPKDGLYIEAGTKFTGPCEGAAPFLVELSKKSIKVNESVSCKVAKFADPAPGALRLNMVCNESEIDGDDDDGQDYKEIMTLRRIDDNSFFMRLSRKGKFPRQEWRVDYCEVKNP